MISLECVLVTFSVVLGALGIVPSPWPCADSVFHRMWIISITIRDAKSSTYWILDTWTASESAQELTLFEWEGDVREQVEILLASGTIHSINKQEVSKK